MKLRWAPRARRDLTGIARWIAADSLQSSQNVTQTIVDAVESLPLFPGQGRPGRMVHTREKVLFPLPYIIIYRVTDSYIEIVRILHGAQRWPN